MSDTTPELSPKLSVPVVANRRVFVPREDTNWQVVESRQHDIDGILTMFKDPEKRAKEINTLATRWDDETGLSFLHILGAELPGLEIHGIAKGLVISASHLIEPDFRNADLEASVFSASVLDNLRADGANLGMSIWTLSEMSGDISGADAVDSNFNLAKLNVNMLRTRLLGSFMIGTQGITQDNIREADFSHSTILSKTGKRTQQTPNDILKTALSARFLGAKKGIAIPVSQALVYRDMELRSALQSGRIAEGQVWLSGDLNDARMVGAELTASILDNIGLQRVKATGIKAAGLVTRLCNLNGIVANGSWAPGSVHISPSLDNADISGGNWPGSVLINPSLRGINAIGTNMDGAVIVSNMSQKQLEEQVKGRIRVIPAADLSDPVRKLIRAVTDDGLGSGTSTSRQLNT